MLTNGLSRSWPALPGRRPARKHFALLAAWPPQRVAALVFLMGLGLVGALILTWLCAPVKSGVLLSRDEYLH